VLFKRGWDAVALAIPGSQIVPGMLLPHGDAVAGTGGYEPDLHGIGQARIGQWVSAKADDLLGGAPALVLVGVEHADVPLFGGELYVDLSNPYWVVTTRASGARGAPGVGSVSLSLNVPNDPALSLSRWIIQVFAVDPGAPFGVSMSNGLAVYMGE